MSDRFDAAANAAAVMTARREVRTMAKWPSRAPATYQDAEAVHAAIARIAGHTVTGWKVGNVDSNQQAKSGIPVVTNAPLYSPWTMASPARFPRASLIAPKFECEFAFAMGHDLPARKTPYTREEVADAVAAFHPAIEIVDGRQPGATPAEALADSMASGGFVYGPAVHDWRKYELGKHPMTLSFDGKVVVEGSGSVILGDPLQALVLFANNPPSWTTLAKGHIVTTGSCIVPHLADKPGTYMADFGALGTVSITMT